jgi:hypothetical protein
MKYDFGILDIGKVLVKQYSFYTQTHPLRIMIFETRKTLRSLGKQYKPSRNGILKIGRQPSPFFVWLLLCSLLFFFFFLFGLF